MMTASQLVYWHIGSIAQLFLFFQISSRHLAGFFLENPAKVFRVTKTSHVRYLPQSYTLRLQQAVPLPLSEYPL